MKPVIEKSTNKAKKLLGIELVRGIAAFAVVLVHSGDGTWGEMSKGVEYLRNLFSFHVPFFLAVSFYFFFKKILCSKDDSCSITELKQRSWRILFPYLKWTLIYLVFRCAFFFLSKDYKSISKLLDDPISILFLGGASYHLYFLPLLLSGTITFYFLNRLIKKWNLTKGLIIFLIGILMNFLISATGNQFQLGPNIAFEELFKNWGMDSEDLVIIRLVSVFAVWSVTCLPYIGAAITLNCIEVADSNDSDLIKKVRQNFLLATLIRSRYVLLASSSLIFLSSTFLIDSSSPLRAFQKVTIAFSLLIIAILISRNISINENVLARVSIDLGKCTLGIYLIHPIFIRTVRFGLAYLFPNFLEDVSVSSVLLISSISFSISWFTIHNMTRNKLLIRYLT